MRIILIGQAAFAEKTLDKLLDKGEKVVAVYCPIDPPSGKFDPVKQKAIQLGIPVRQHKSFKAPEVCDEFVALNADLAILAFVTQIVPQQVFSVPKLGSICFHPSLLPKYRGASAINWALIRGEIVTGLYTFLGRQRHRYRADPLAKRSQGRTRRHHRIVVLQQNLSPRRRSDRRSHRPDQSRKPAAHRPRRIESELRSACRDEPTPKSTGPNRPKKSIT